MSVAFRRAYNELTEFVDKHPEIEIGDSVTSIPESVRAAFYGMFNDARDAFVTEKFASLLERAAELQDKYNTELETASSWLSLEDPPSVDPVRRFLCDPKDCLARELFDPLFDLLKGRTSIDEIEKTVTSKIETLFASVFRAGYEKWVVLSLLNVLEVESSFRVFIRNMNAGERSKPAAQAPLEEVPVPQESKSLFFSQPRNAIFTVPDFIAYSPRLHRFVGIRSDFHQSAYNAMNASNDREWDGIDRDLLVLMSKGLTLVYVAEQVQAISLVADAAKFCRPDLVLWCVDPQSMNQADVMAVMRQADSRLKPAGGVYMIASGEWPEASVSPGGNVKKQQGEESAGIHWLNAGYDRMKLTPVAEALVDSTDAALST